MIEINIVPVIEDIEAALDSRVATHFKWGSDNWDAYITIVPNGFKFFDIQVGQGDHRSGGDKRINGLNRDCALAIIKAFISPYELLLGSVDRKDWLYDRFR